MKQCKICGRKVHAHGLCSTHYMKLRRYGDSMTAPPMGAKKGSVRLYMERTGEWDEMLTFTSDRSRKKYLKAVNQLFTLLCKAKSLGHMVMPNECAGQANMLNEDETVAVELAKSLAVIIAFDEDTAKWDFTNLESSVDRLFNSKNWLEELDTLSCGQIR
jgi:hypothetical protein